MDAFLSTMARMATGSLQGKAQATQDYQEEQEKQQAQSQALLLAKLKQEAEREASVRNHAFEYAGSLQKVLENPDNLKYAQDNNLLPQFGREIQNGMDVAAGIAAFGQSERKLRACGDCIGHDLSFQPRGGRSST